MGAVTAVNDTTAIQRDFSCEAIALMGGVPSGWTVLYDTCGQYFADAFASPFASFGTGAATVTLISGTTPINVTQVGSEFTVSVDSGDLISATTAIDVSGTGHTLSDDITIEFLPGNVDLADIGGSLSLNQLSATGATNGDVVTLVSGVWTYATPSTSTTDLTFTGASSPVTLNSSTGTDVTITAGTGISLSATGTNLTITSTATGTVTGSGTATRVAFWSSSSALSSSPNLYWDNSNSRLGVNTATPSVALHYVGSLYGISGQHQFGRYNQAPATPYSALEFEGKQADPVSVSTPSEDAVAVIRAMTSGGVRAAPSLAFGVWSNTSYGVWMQARSTSAFNTYYPILTQPRGGKLAVGRVSSTANSALFTVRGGTTSSTGAGNYLANFESTEGSPRIGISTGTDSVKGSFMYDGVSVISRLTNLDGSASATIRFSIGSSETSDKLVILPTGNGLIGAGFSSTTGLHSTLQSSGSIAGACLNTVGAPTFDATKFAVVYAGSTNQTYTLPSASGVTGRIFWIMHHGSAGTITLSANVKTASGSSFNTLAAGEMAIFTSDGLDFRGKKW